MSAPLYPVAKTADQALHAPLGAAEREREAVAMAGGAVAFASEPVGPAFESREALVAALGEQARNPACQIRPMLAEGARPKAVTPVNKGGRRWPEPKPRPKTGQAGTLWRLSISYWRIEGGEAAAPHDAARILRRSAEAEALDARSLRALAHQPLRPVRPQQPLDIGLFEARLPEAPDRIVPDE